jgi:hypothetical protein
VPSGGSVSADVGTSLLRLGAIVAVFAAVIAAIGLLARAMTGQLRLDRLARRRLRDRQQRDAIAAQSPPAVVPQPRSERPPTRRRPAAGHHPAGRRVPGAQAAAAAVRPRRPLQLVAADLRRLTRELSMVPGGMPMARRRGLLAAFDDVLIEAAELLEVPNQLTAEPPATRELERMRLLATLEAAGLVVTD